MNPLNFSDLGYDITGAPSACPGGEIWCETNFAIRQAGRSRSMARPIPATTWTSSPACAERQRPPGTSARGTGAGSSWSRRVPADATIGAPCSRPVTRTLAADLEPDASAARTRPSSGWLSPGTASVPGAACTTTVRRPRSPTRRRTSTRPGANPARDVLSASATEPAPLPERAPLRRRLPRRASRPSPTPTRPPRARAPADPNLDDSAAFVPGHLRLRRARPSGYGHTAA